MAGQLRKSRGVVAGGLRLRWEEDYGSGDFWPVEFSAAVVVLLSEDSVLIEDLAFVLVVSGADTSVAAD